METLLKRIILLHTLMLLLTVVWNVFYSTGQDAIDHAPTSIINIILLAFSILYLICLYLIYNLNQFGKQIYLPLLAFSIGLIFVLPIEFFAHKTHITVLLFDLINISAGMIIVLIHCPDMKHKFSR